MISTIRGWLIPQTSPESVMLAYAETGDSAQLEKLVSLFADDLFHFIVSQCKYELAADICQQTWIKVIDHRHQYRAKGNFKTWLFTLARNTMIDEFRRTRRLAETDLSDYREPNDHGELSIEENDQSKLNQALLMLPFSQRETLILQLEGFSLADIALITGEHHETIKSRLRYARQFLKNQLGDDHAE